jgi:hypothetical protein
MIIDATEQFHPFRSGPVIGTVVNDQDGFSIVIGQGIENSKQPPSETKEKSPPVKTGSSKHLVGSIFAEGVIFVDHDATKEVLSGKWQ